MALANKSVVVTGAAHGIGRAYSERLAADGASVALLDIDAKRNEEVADGIRKGGGKALAIAADVRDFASFKRAVDQAAKAFGSLTGIVNNAGMLNVIPITRCNFEDIPDAEWDQAFTLNTKAAWYGCKSVLPYLRKAGGGSIVNIASRAAIRAAPPHLAAYGASKGAVHEYTMTVAIYCARAGYNIRCNSINPGAIDTPLLQASFDQAEDPEKRRQMIVGRVPLGRMGRPIDIAYAALYLASDESAYVTGTSLNVDGGVTAA